MESPDTRFATLVDRCKVAIGPDWRKDIPQQVSVKETQGFCKTSEPTKRCTRCLQCKMYCKALWDTIDSASKLFTFNIILRMLNSYGICEPCMYELYRKGHYESRDFEMTVNKWIHYTLSNTDST